MIQQREAGTIKFARVRYESDDTHTEGRKEEMGSEIAGKNLDMQQDPKATAFTTQEAGRYT